MPRDEAVAMAHRERVLPVKPDDPMGEHAVDRESTFSVAASAIEGTAFCYKSPSFR